MRLLLSCLFFYVLLIIAGNFLYQAFTGEAKQEQQKELPEDPQGVPKEEYSLNQIVQYNNLNYTIDIPWDEYIRVEGSNERQVAQETRKTTYGINVSYYQQDIDWKTVADQGVEYAIIRIGYRGYENGVIANDPNYERYMREISQTNMGIGGYFFSQAITKEEMDEEIEYMLEKMKNYNITYPVGISLGRHSEEADVQYRTSNLSDDEYCNLLKYYCIRMKEVGYTPVIYFSSEEEYERLDSDMLKGYPLWMTNMTSNLDNTQGVFIWQYRNYINMKGIEKKWDVVRVD